MVFRGRGGRPPRGRGRGRGGFIPGFIPRGRGGTGSNPRGRGSTSTSSSISSHQQQDSRERHERERRRERERSRSRSRSRSPSRSKSKRERSHISSKDRRASSRDRESHDRHGHDNKKDERTRAQNIKHSEPLRGRNFFPGSHDASLKKRRDRSRSRSPDDGFQLHHGRHQNEKRRRSRSPPSNRRSRSPKHSHDTSDNSHSEDEGDYTQSPSGFYDDIDPPQAPGPSRWDSPARGSGNGSPRRDSPNADASSSSRGQESSRRGDLRSQEHVPKFRGSGAASSLSTHNLQTESLRITVGNERFQGKSSDQEDKPVSAMDRLGPPVGKDFQSSSGDLDDLYQDLPSPTQMESIPQPRGDLPIFPIESSQKKILQPKSKAQSYDKHQIRSDDSVHHGGGARDDNERRSDTSDRDKSKDRGKEIRSKRSKERDDDKGKSRHKEHSAERQYGDDKRRHSRERDRGSRRSRERSSHDRENRPHSRSESDPHQRRESPHTPSMDPAFNQATLLVQSIRQQGTSKGPPTGPPGGNQSLGSSGEHPPNIGAPYALQPPGGADGMYHQSSQSGYPNPTDGYFQQQQQQQQQHPQMMHHQQQQHFQQQYQQQPPPNQFPPTSLSAPHTEFNPNQSHHSQGMGPPTGHTPQEPEKKALDVNFGSVDEEDLFLYGDLGDGKTDKREQKTDSTHDFWQKMAPPTEEYNPEVTQPEPVAPTAPVPEKKSTDMEDDQIKKILSVIGFDFDLAKKIADQKKQQQEEEELRKQARASKRPKSSIKPPKDVPTQETTQNIQSIAGNTRSGEGQHENWENPPVSSFNPTSSFLDLHGASAGETDSSLDSFVHNAKQNVTQSQQAYQHERMPAPPPQVTNWPQGGPSQQQQEQMPGPPPQGLPSQGPPSQGPPLQSGYPPGAPLLPPLQFDAYGRPIPPSAVNFPMPMPGPPPPGYPPFYPQQPPHMHPGGPPPMHPGGPPPMHPGGPPPPQGFGPAPITHPQPYYPEQSGPQFQPPPQHHQGQQLYEGEPSAPYDRQSHDYQRSPEHGYKQSPDRSSDSRSGSRSSSRSSSSDRSSSQSETPERSPPKSARSHSRGRSRNRSRNRSQDRSRDRGRDSSRNRSEERSQDRSRSHSHSVSEHRDERENKKRSSFRDDKQQEYGPEAPSTKESSPRRIVLLPKSERNESSRKRKHEEANSLDKLKDLERTELQKLQKLYKDEREALDKKKRKAEEKERVLEEKKIQQALKRKENERRKEREADEKKRQAIAKRKKEEEQRRKREDERERIEVEQQKKKIEKQLKIREAHERARQCKLSQDKAIYSKRLEALESALSRLRKQEGELLRKKQRERAGHKDPILIENGKLQEEISSQLKTLREAFTAGTVQQVDFEERVFTEEMKLRDKAFAKKLEEVDARKLKERDEKKTGKSSKSKSALTDEEKAERQPFQFTYNDPGDHWCKLCKLSLQSLNNLFIHLHSKKHLQKCDPYCRPWVPDDLSTKKSKDKDSSTLKAPLGGAEFMMPVNAFYCKLCREFSGDGFCASEHLKSVKHNIKYQKFIEENPGYVKKLTLERAADEKISDENVKEKRTTTPDADHGDKKDDKGKMKVDIGQRPGGGFGRFRFLKKEGDKTKENNGREESREDREVKKEPEAELELRKSEPAKPIKQQPSKEKEESTIVKDPKKITIKISTPRHFVPHSIAKPASVSQITMKPFTKVTTPASHSAHVETKARPVIKAEPLASKLKHKSKNKLDSFLSIGEQGKSLPVIKEPEKTAQPSQDQIADAFSGKSTAQSTGRIPEEDPKSGENEQKPSFSDTLRKMLFTSSQKESQNKDSSGSSPTLPPSTSHPSLPSAEPENLPKLPPPKRPPGLKSPVKKTAAAVTKTLFDALLSGKKQPGIPGIDDELMPPGT